MCNSVYVWSSISSTFAQAVNRQPLIGEARVRSQTVDRLALGQTLLQVIQYSSVSIILPMLHTHLHYRNTFTRKEMENRNRNKKTTLFSNRGAL